MKLPHQNKIQKVASIVLLASASLITIQMVALICISIYFGSVTFPVELNEDGKIWHLAISAICFAIVCSIIGYQFDKHEKA